MRRFTLSAQQVDPLSWFLGTRVPVAFTSLIVVFGAVQTALLWSTMERPWLQVFALALFAGCGLVVQAAVAPLRPPLGSAVAGAALSLAVLGTAASAAGFAHVAVRPELWWASIGLAVSISSLAPNLSVQRMLWLGSAATAVMLVLVFVVVRPQFQSWSTDSEVLLTAAPPLLGMTGTAVFAWSIVNAALPHLEDPSRLVVSGRPLGADQERAERERLARLTARAAPLLESVARSRRVAPHDRALAQQVARRLRDELVSTSRIGWLDERVSVSDPHGLAHQLDNAQRTTLREFVRAVLALPGADPSSVKVAFRRAPDGATGVAVTLDRALPEGRHVLHLAPYYLTLGRAVDALTLRDGRVSFRVRRQGGHYPALPADPS